MPFVKAAPRSPLPPFPERILRSWRFDGEAWLTNAHTVPFAALNVQFVESWSGQALRIGGVESALFALAEEGADGRLNLSMNGPGSIRFWFAPEWTSASAGGSGPGAVASLFEVGAWSEQGAVGWWALGIDPSGNTIRFVAQGGGATAAILEALISWTTGQWHQVALAWDPQGKTRLCLDGVPAAEAGGLPLKPLTGFSGTRGFCAGSDVSGGHLAQGQFEELYTFDHALSAGEVAGDHERNAPRWALGPVTEEEEEARLAAAVLSLAQIEPAGGGQTQFAMGSAQYGCSLWLEISKSSNPDEVLMTAHNTVAGKTYQLWSTENLNDLNWSLEQTLPGAVGQEFTVFAVPMQGASGMRPALFFQVTEVSSYVVGTSFAGLGLVDTEVNPPDSMGAVGPEHFVELLNGVVIVYDKTGQTVEGPLSTLNFFELEEGGVTYPTGWGMFDPRVLYDHEANRWVACGLDGFGSRDVLLAVSEDDQPVPLLTHWNKYRVPFSRALELTDFPTLGMDANGIYISVQYFNTQSNAVVAISKSQLYQGAYQAWTFQTASTAPHRRIIHPVVNFDAPPAADYAWMIAKGPPEYGSGPYRGGPVIYRRMQWTAGVPDWVDSQWQVVSEPNPTYRDYFDLDEGDAQNGAPQAGGPIKIRVDGSQSGGVGSILTMAVIRDGVLWTCHHVGLDGADGDYDGDESGASVDRSAVQWLRLEIDASGHLVAVNNESHGRIYDDCEITPFWYYCPSLMVNANGDMVTGFSGSSEYSYISAFYAWRLADGTVSDGPGLIKGGEDYFGHVRWGDYSSTCLDPSDENTFWTVQEHAEPVDFSTILVGPTWGTRIAVVGLGP